MFHRSSILVVALHIILKRSIGIRLSITSLLNAKANFRSDALKFTCTKLQFTTLLNNSPYRLRFGVSLEPFCIFPIGQQASKSIQYVPLSNGGLARDLCSSTVAFVKKGYWPRFLQIEARNSHCSRIKSPNNCSFCSRQTAFLALQSSSLSLRHLITLN